MSTMNPETKAKWLAALRGGDYKQVQHMLKSTDGGFCCLGVLADLHGAKWEPRMSSAIRMRPSIDEAYVDDINNEYLSASFCATIGMPYDRQHEFARMNDDGKTFAEIADAVEANL